jgi:RNA 2',3'-cyclic 3'-phosphodiesterase
VRLFVAVDLDEPLRRAVAAVAVQVRRAFDRTVRGARVSWTAPDRMHITLHFLGELGPTRADAAMDALREPLPIEPFTLSIGTSGAFPAHGRPRVLWFGVKTTGDAMDRLHHAVGDRLSAAGLPVDAAAFTAHLTIARVRTPVGVGSTAAALAGVPKKIGSCRVGAVTLYESRLGGRSSTYVALASAALRDSSR